MAYQLFLVPGMLYVCIYLFYVRRALKGVSEILVDYEINGKLINSLDWSQSITAVKLILDSTMPREDFPNDLKRSIKLARFFFYTSFPVCFFCWLLMVFFSY